MDTMSDPREQRGLRRLAALEQQDRDHEETVAEELEHWFAQALGPDRTPRGYAAAIGRHALASAGGTTRWRDALLSDEPPAELVQALRAAAMIPAPIELPGEMPEQVLEPSLLSLTPFGPALRLVRGATRARLARLAR